jgi:hypothetical protein
VRNTCKTVIFCPKYRTIINVVRNIVKVLSDCKDFDFGWILKCYHNINNNISNSNTSKNTIVSITATESNKPSTTLFSKNLIINNQYSINHINTPGISVTKIIYSNHTINNISITNSNSSNNNTTTTLISKQQQRQQQHQTMNWSI